jgi:membrane protease YdiL (CAAX protease family)
MEESAKVLTERFLNTSSVGMMLVNLLVMALLPAVCEEMMFRGWLQRVLGKSVNYHTAIWVSAFVFSAIHFQFYGFIPRMLIGAALGYLYYYTGSLWAPIVAHFTNNAAAVVTAFLTYNGYTSIDFDLIGTGDTWYLSVVSVAVCVVLMSRLMRR